MERNIRPYLQQNNYSDRTTAAGPFIRDHRFASTIYQPSTSTQTKYSTSNYKPKPSTYTSVSSVPSSFVTASASKYDRDRYNTYSGRARTNSSSSSAGYRFDQPTYYYKDDPVGTRAASTNEYVRPLNNSDLAYRRPEEESISNSLSQRNERIIPIQRKDEKHLGGVRRRDYSTDHINRRSTSAHNIVDGLPSYMNGTDYYGSNSKQIHERPTTFNQVLNSIDSRSKRDREQSQSRLSSLDHNSHSSQPTTKESPPAHTPLALANHTSPRPQHTDDIYQRFPNSSSATTAASQQPQQQNHQQQQRMQPTMVDDGPLRNMSLNDAAALPPAPAPARQSRLMMSQPRPMTSNASLYTSYYQPENEKSKTVIAVGMQNGVHPPGQIVPCLKGLTNHGNTCYFSSIIQCLSCCARLAEFYIKNYQIRPEDGNKNVISNAMATTIRCLWFNHSSADLSSYKLLNLVIKSNSQMVLSRQQDAHESMIWLLDHLHEEVKEVDNDALNNNNNNIIPIRTRKSEGELAHDALAGTTKHSPVMNIFCAQFRSAMECTNPVCGFTNLTFDPYLTVSLSVPYPKKPREFSVLFIPFFNSRQIVRYHFQISESLSDIAEIKERIMKKLSSSAGDEVSISVACIIQTNGQCQLLPDNATIDNRLTGLILLEVPKLNEQQILQDLVVAVVVFVVGVVPDGERFGYPFVVVLNRQWNYNKICNFLLEKGQFLMPRAFYPLPSDYTLLVQNNDGGVACLDADMGKPLFHEGVNKALYNDERRADNMNILKLIVEWGSSARYEFNRAPTETVLNDYSSLRNLSQGANEFNFDKEMPIPLVSLIEDYVKSETIQDWKCAKCGKSPGRKELKFHSLPDVLIFHLKRFELLNDGLTKKIDSQVQIPLEGLDMSPFVYNPDIRASTLPKHRKERYAIESFINEGFMFDLIGVVNHFGERTNSGHYTATTRNPIDGQWRTFDDSRVSQPLSNSEIRISTKSYLLFYERRSQQKTTAASSWFPNAIPAEVLNQYKRESASSSSSAGEERVLERGKSKFYTIVDSPEKERAPSLVAERTVPLTPIPTTRHSSMAPPSSFSYSPSLRRTIEPYSHKLSQPSASSRLFNTSSNQSHNHIFSRVPSANRLEYSRFSSYRF